MPAGYAQLLLTKADVLLTKQKAPLQAGTSVILMVSLQPALSPQFASLVGAGLMLLLMVKVESFFYELPNVSGPDRTAMPREPGVQIASWWVCLSRTALSMLPQPAPASLGAFPLKQ